MLTFCQFYSSCCIDLDIYKILFSYFAKYIREERSTTFKNCLKNFTFNKPTSHGDFEQTFNFKKIVKIGTKLGKSSS